jgi:hypothetical protein|tara:strand:+ start:2836 stop:3042 length:207 start_codon:yes stop_codon:yes gene_type:complete
MSLKDDINRAVYEEIPVNNACPKCSKLLDTDDVLIDPVGRMTAEDTRSWDRLATKVIRVIIEHLEEAQ